MLNKIPVGGINLFEASRASRVRGGVPAVGARCILGQLPNHAPERTALARLA